MKRAAAVLFFLLLSCARADDVPTYDYRIIESHPHSTDAFTQGLLFHEGYLYEGTGRYGQSSLSRIRLEDGAVLQRHNLSQEYFGEGIAVVDERIYQLTWRENMVFVYDLEGFERIDAHYHPGEGWGLTYNGEELILSDGSDELQFIEPEGFTVSRRLPVTVAGEPLHNLNELEYINGEVWANIWMQDRIARIDPVSGQVVGMVDLTGLRDETSVGGREAVLNGIAWDEAGERILVTGKLWAHLFEIELVPRRSVSE